MERAASAAAPSAARPARARKGGALAALEAAPAPDADADTRGPLGLPVLRGRLRAAGVRQGRRVIQIEGDPDSPISRGRLCPKGSASEQLREQPRARVPKVKYRRPHGTEWEELDLETAMDMIADRVVAARGRDLGGATRRATRSRRHARASPTRRRHARQRGELPDQEALHRARRGADREPGAHMTLLHGPRSGDLVRSRWRHHVPAGPAELRLHRDHGSNMAECHPVGFQWVMEARRAARG